MFKYIYLLLFIVTLSGSLVHAAPIPEVDGVWDNQQTYCRNTKNNSIQATRIIGIPLLGFEPHVRLKIYETQGVHNVEKIVLQSSCEVDPTVKVDHFFKST